MENSSKKYWIIALVIPITIVGLFVAYMIITYAHTYSISTPTSVGGSAPTSEVASDYKGGVYMNETVDTTSAATGQDVIKTAYISMSADNMDTTLTSIQALEKEYNSQTSNLQDSGKGSERIISLTIKVEESKFEELYNKIKALPGEFTYSSIGSTDITETVQDLQSRLDNQQKLLTQLNSILKQATTVADTLAVQKEITTAQTEIESLQTQLKNYDNQTSYSYITVYISQSASGSQLSDNKWLPLGILKDAGRDLVGFAKFLGTGLIYVLVFSPVIAAVVVPVIIIQKKAKK